MKKNVTTLIPFPKLRRTEQTGLTQRSFPVRWLGLLLMTTVGGAWALNPVSEQTLDTKLVESRLTAPVFEGEPQIVSQLMGATVGAEFTPTRQLRPVGVKAQRVVVTTSSPMVEAQDSAGLFRAVEELESEYTANGSYPALPAESTDLHGAGYQVEAGRFKLTGQRVHYDSDRGLQVVKSDAEQPEAGGYRVVGYLNEVVNGWGPWKTPGRRFESHDEKVSEDLAWLGSAAETPSWSARVYFPVSREQTGYAFRRSNGTSAYSSGEFLYDGVNGTFRLKLNRSEAVGEHLLSSEELEQALAGDGSACGLVGESGFLQDLGFLSVSEDVEGVTQVSIPTRLNLSGGTALDGLTLAAFSRHARGYDAGGFAPKEGEEGKATVVGRLEMVDRLGQIHHVRMRAGRAESYDWIVGQLCEQAPEKADLLESTAYDDGFRREVAKTILVGK